VAGYGRQVGSQPATRSRNPQPATRSPFNMTVKSNKTLQERTTTLAADEVLARAKSFFSRRSTLYATFVDKEGPGYVTFRGQGGEEIVIGTAPADGGTRVRGSTYLFDMQVSRFLETLPGASTT
jgi:hypothetical protein